MQVGLLENYKEEVVKELQKKGTPVVLGIEPNSLLQDIEIQLVQNRYDPVIVLQIIQQELMMITGRIIIKEPEPKTEASNNVR